MDSHPPPAPIAADEVSKALLRRHFLELLRDDPAFRKALRVAFTTDAMEVVKRSCGMSDEQAVQEREKAINDALGIETKVEIDKSVPWEEAFELDWGLFNKDERATDFVACVAHVSRGASVNYFANNLHPGCSGEAARIEEALRQLELTQFIHPK